MRELVRIERELLRQLSLLDGTEVGLFEVTAVQLNKGIVDANFSIRQAFRSTGFHDYATQVQGKEHKVVADIALLTPNGLAETKISLYRPVTKTGDPRLWIYRLEQLHPATKPGDIVAIIQDGEVCAALNLSDHARAGTSVEPVASLLRGNSPDLHGAASELLEKLRRVASAGPVLTSKKGDTAVGYAVETALGIRANSSRDPDFKGVEIKSGRSHAGNANKTLFGKMFDKARSPVGSYSGLLNRCGYLKDDGLKYLQCSVSGMAANPQGLYLSVDFESGLLNERWHGGLGDEVVALWELAVLQDALTKKHSETFWVEAHEVDTPNGRGFALRKVLHTSTPRLSAFTLFLSDGTVFVDHTIRQKRDGGTRDHGMLFRTKAANLSSLFNVVGEYSLA